jgi:hypothetical protein
VSLRELAYLGTILASAGQRRHAVRWLRSRDATFFLETPSPWLTFDAIERIRGRMKDGMRVFGPRAPGNAAPKVARGGVLVLDNAERAYYVTRAGDALKAFRHESFPGVGPRDATMWRTDLYVRT